MTDVLGPPDAIVDARDGLADLAQVQERAVELLGRLPRQPSNLRIQVGDITVDITWATGPAERPAVGPVNGPVDGPAVGPDPHGASGDADTAAAAKEYLTSPAVGVFYHAKEPGAEPFVSVGSPVEPGQQIGIVEAMKLMIPVAADRAGVITDVLKANGAPVEYDEPLFAVAAPEA
jgi:acetyl-CoA carboxylase biotin carboxyl carrier protein